jgi:hypothetical protein
MIKLETMLEIMAKIHFRNRETKERKDSGFHWKKIINLLS